MRLWKPPRDVGTLAGPSVASQLAKRLGVRTDAPLIPLPEDPWEFARQCAYTQDEHAGNKGVKVVRKLVADAGDEYLEVVTREVLREKKLCATKARQLRVTWLLAALFVHDVLTNRGHRNGYQTKKWDDAAAYLRDRMWFIYEHIPARFAVPKARLVEGCIEVFHDGSKLPTAWIMALSEGADQARQWTFSWFWSDEFAFQLDQEKTLTAVQPSLDGGGRHTITSSPYRGTHMGKILFGDVASGPVEEERPVFRDAIFAWRRNGYRCLRIEYWCDPHKAKMWPDRDVAPTGYSSRQWRQEQRNDWTVQSGDPVYCDTDRIVKRTQCYHSKLTLVRMWDFGFNFPCCGFFQVEPAGAGRPMPTLRGILVLRGRRTAIEHFATQRVLATTADMFPGARCFDCGDPAGNNTEGTSGESAIKVLAGLGIHVRTMREKINISAKLLQTIISLGLLELDPTGCRHLIDDLSGGYHLDEDGVPVKDDECDHEPDLLRYGCWNLFRYGGEKEPRIVERGVLDMSRDPWTPEAAARR